MHQVNDMREETYAKCCRLAGKYRGYVSTAELLKEGLTNRQIAEFVTAGMLEKVCFGVYWFLCGEYQKPRDYKAIEIAKSDPRAVICADSACFYHGLITVEPPAVSVATPRTDRSRLGLNFPVSRHYYAENTFSDYQKIVDTDYGRYTVFDLERSVCDCIRFKDSIDEDIFALVIECYRKQDKSGRRLLEYAGRLHMLNQMREYLILEG